MLGRERRMPDTTIKVLTQRTQEQRSDNNERLCQVEDTEKKGGGGMGEGG